MDNLDPFRERTQAEVWQALDTVRLGEWARGEGEGLEMHVSRMMSLAGLLRFQRFQRQSCGQDAQLEFEELYGRGSWGAERRTRTMEQAKRDWGLLPQGAGGKL